MKHKIYGNNLPNIPFEPRPEGCNSPIWRYSKNPVINTNPFENAERVFNSAVMAFNGEFVGVFRADTKSGVPYLFLGHSKDGINFTFDPKPIEFHDQKGNKVHFEYAYDPRLVELEGMYYIIFCTSLHGPTIGIGRTKDFKVFELIDNPFLPFNRNGVLFPRKINGEYAMLSRPSDSGHTMFGDIFLSYSKDMEYWGHHKHVMEKGYEWWCGTKIGAGPAPIETDLGWLIFFHGANLTCSGLVYSIGAAIVDRDDPSKVLHRCGNYLLAPNKLYETTGYVPNVLFPVSCLTDAKTGRIAIYAGGADTVTELLFTDIDTVIDYILKYERQGYMELVTISKRNSPFRKIWGKIGRSKYLIMMIIPAIVFYFIFNYIPMYGILMAFKDFRPKLGVWNSPWNGVANFVKVFEEPKFWLAFKNTLIIGSVKIVISFLGAVTIALLLNELRMRKTKKTIQTIVTFPHFLSWVVVSGFVFALFAYNGAVNGLVEAMGGERTNFLKDKYFFFGMVFASDVWKEAGWGSIIYLATMAGIPQDQYEAADIDGATRLQKIWHITLPGIKPVAILLLIMSVGGVLSAGFDQILNLGNKLIREDVNIIDTYIYYHAIVGSDSAGVGTAIGLFKSVISFALVITVDRIAKACGERGIIQYEKDNVRQTSFTSKKSNA